MSFTPEETADRTRMAFRQASGDENATDRLPDVQRSSVSQSSRQMGQALRTFGAPRPDAEALEADDVHSHWRSQPAEACEADDVHTHWRSQPPPPFGQTHIGAGRQPYALEDRWDVVVPPPAVQTGFGAYPASTSFLPREEPPQEWQHGVGARGPVEHSGGASSSWEGGRAGHDAASRSSPGQWQQPQEAEVEQDEESETSPDDATEFQLPATLNGIPVTTLMLRNLPPRLSQQRLLQCLPQPHVAKYNVLHVPNNGGNRHSSGYAFLNFERHEDAVAFNRQWQRRRLLVTPESNIGSSRVIKIEVAKHQGFVANLLQWGKSMRGLTNPAMLPAIFIHGQRQDFWQYIAGMQSLSGVRTFEGEGGIVTLSF